MGRDGDDGNAGGKPPKPPKPPKGPKGPKPPKPPRGRGSRRRGGKGPKYLISPKIARQLRGPFGGLIGPSLLERPHRSVWSHIHSPFNHRVSGAVLHPSTRRGRITRGIAVTALIVALLAAAGVTMLVLDRSNNNLRTALSGAHRDLTSAHRDIADQKAKITDQNNQLIAVESQLDDLNNQIADLNGQIDRYRKQNAKLQSEATGLQTANSTLRTTVQNCQTALTSLTQAVSLQARATAFDLNALQAIQAGNTDQANSDIQQGATLVGEANSLLTSSQAAIDACQTGLADLTP